MAENTKVTSEEVKEEKVETAKTRKPFHRHILQVMRPLDSETYIGTPC